jgi:hypothetical protein
MAKVASSKPYGSSARKSSTPTTPKKGNSRKSLTSEAIKSSPVRTSPRRRKEAEEEKETNESTEPATTSIAKKSKPKTKKPTIPLFSDSTSTKSKKKTKVNEEELPVAQEAESEIEDYIESFLNEDEEMNDSEHVENVNEHDETFENDEHFEASSKNEYSSENEESFNEQETYNEYEEEEEEDNNEQDSSNYDPFHYNSSSENVYNDEAENSEILNEQVQYSESFRYTSQNVRNRLAEYFNRQEAISSSAASTATAIRSRLWNKMKNWISESVLIGAKEIGDLTKKAIEALTAKNENVSTNYNNDIEQQVAIEDEMDYYEGSEETKRMKLMEDEDDLMCSRIEEVREEVNVIDHDTVNEAPNATRDSRESHTSYHSLPTSIDSFASVEGKPIASATGNNYFDSSVLGARLTEIILFLAKCSATTPISLIYEHLEELFTLKGSVPLNLTEKQLVSTVLRDFLVEEEVDESHLAQQMPVPVFEPLVLSTSNSHNHNEDSSSRVRVLPASGIRFRAPKFTAEEEARFEASEKQTRDQPFSIRSTPNRMKSVTSTPLQRLRIQKKLLPFERTAALLDSLPENQETATNNRHPTTPIDEIISQKVKRNCTIVYL